ncbi:MULTISPECIES: hypothetical protein [Flavobacterium]|uniref:Uncharacterized protein n=1 Tax=Flavobacterium jumunjinense TaxID=998845 RepID=A0ABV5GQ95_9FLAO|nr:MULTISPECIES: hypothetical protein [Flavobacterium]
MKTVEELKLIIVREQKFIEEQRELKVTKGIKPASRKIALCNCVLAYLDSNPKEEWLKEQKFLLQCRIKNALSNYEYWVQYCTKESIPKKQKILFNKENGITRMRQQIRFINFILNSN